MELLTKRKQLSSCEHTGRKEKNKQTATMHAAISFTSENKLDEGDKSFVAPRCKSSGRQ